MSYNVLNNIQLFRVNQVNGCLADSSYDIITIPGNCRFYPLQLIVEVNCVNALLTPPSISFGASSFYTSLLNDTPLTDLTGVNNMLIIPLTTSISSVDGGTILGVKIKTAATGSPALFYNLTCSITGYFV